MTIIHGILPFHEGRRAEVDMQTMLQATVHFADAGSSYCQQGKMLLGANLLKTLPTGRHEGEPVVTDAESGLSIVANVRIDNRHELFAALKVDQAERNTISDTRLILRAFQCWGQDCAEKLIGDFAFAIWNSREQTLFCCRDVFGIRPFYYYHSNEGFIFSSDLLPLFRLARVPKQLDEGYIADQIGGLDLYSNKTPYQNIHCLGKAHWLQIDASGQLRSECYWQPDLQREVTFPNETDYVEQYRELFTEAVNCRLVSDNPVASFISGGLDSSAIAAVAGKHLMDKKGQPVHSFCHVLPADESNPDEDEKALVELMTQQPEINNTWVSTDKFLPLLESQYGTDDPFALKKEGFFHTSLLLAQQQGCKVFFNGFGGDQVATCHAYDLAGWQLREGNFKGFFHQANALSRDSGRSLSRTLAGLLYRQHPFQSQVTSEKAIRQFLDETCVYSPEFANQFDVLSMAKTAHRFTGGRPQTFRESMWKDLSEGVNPHNDAAAAFSRVRMESRQPMFDRRLVAFCLAVPPEQHRLGQFGRRLIRRAMQDILPDEIRLRHNKRYSSNPGIERYLGGQLDGLRLSLQALQTVPAVGKYIDLTHIQQRFDELPTLLAEGRQNEFKLGATTRALGLGKFLMCNYQRETVND